jgi:hypothetical protein
VFRPEKAAGSKMQIQNVIFMAFRGPKAHGDRPRKTRGPRYRLHSVGMAHLGVEQMSDIRNADITVKVVTRIKWGCGEQHEAVSCLQNANSATSEIMSSGCAGTSDEPWRR